MARAGARLVDGYDPATRRYEQFAGYFALEPLLIGDVAVPPVAADLLLGRDRVARSQLIKQPDVLMLHHLVPDQVEPGSLGPNLDYYGPRTAHGRRCPQRQPRRCWPGRAGRMKRWPCCGWRSRWTWTT